MRERRPDDGNAATGPLAEPTSRLVRGANWVLTVLGPVIAIVMAVIWRKLEPLMVHPGVTDASGATFNGTAAQVTFIRQTFALVIAFGLAMTMAGIVQLRSGQPNRPLTILGLVLFGLLLVQGARSKRMLRPADGETAALGRVVRA